MSVRRMDPPTLSMSANRSRSLRPRSPAEFLEPSRAPERPSGRRRRRENKPLSGFIRLVSGILTMIVIALGLVAGGFFVVQNQFTTPGPLSETRTVAIPPGSGRLKVAEILENEGVISNRFVFIVSQLAMNVAGLDRRELKAGEYEVEPGASMASVYEAIVTGRGVLYKVTLPEGLTSQQIVERLRAAPDLTGEIVEVPPEGSLLPDTYSFSKGVARQDILDRMRDAQTRVVTKAWENRKPDLPLKSIEEALILASIVEKETGQVDEREEVAGVFINRLRKNMRLQSDPTIIYGIAGGAGSLGRPIYKRDIEAKTEYNTYQIDGLPPTPISNPGRGSIEAVLNPADTENLFFVADGTGGHTFSATYRDHTRAVANWRKIEREARKREASQAPVSTTVDTSAATRAVVRTAPPPSPAPDTAVAAASGASIAAPIVLNGSEPGETAAASAGGSDGASAIVGPVPLPARKPR